MAKRKKKLVQTWFGDKPFKIRNKVAIKRGSMKYYEPTERTPEGIMADLEDVYHRSKFYALTSGGKDSVSLTHWLASQEKLEACVFVDTGVGLKQTKAFVKDLCQSQGWKLHIIKPNPPHIYATHVLGSGCPGPTVHHVIMGKIKFQPMRNFALSIDRYNHCLISGVRKFESKERFGNYPHPIQTDGSLWFGCPFFYKQDKEIYEYIHHNGLKISPVHDILGVSGDCMCGSYPTHGQKLRIRELDPELADYLQWLEDGIQKYGTAKAKKYPKWGDSARMSQLEQQKQLVDYMEDHPEEKENLDFETLICGNECGPGTLKGEMDFDVAAGGPANG